jgi:hypothetical protein
MRGWLFVASEATGKRIEASYEFRIGEETFNFHIANGEARARQGPASTPRLILERTLLSGQLTAEQALNRGAARLDGPRHELDRVLRIFRFPADQGSGRPRDD